MTPEELEQTEQMKTMIIETETDDEEQSVLEMIEEFEDKIKKILNKELPLLAEEGYKAAKEKDTKIVGKQLIKVYKSLM